MKMVFFRPTFLTAGMLLQTLALLCVLFSVSSVSAVPQFGRPMMHALDDVPEPSRLSVPFFAASTEVPSASATASPSVTANATASAATSATPSGGSTSGAAHHLGSAHAAFLLSAAVSVVFFAC